MKHTERPSVVESMGYRENQETAVLDLGDSQLQDTRYPGTALGSFLGSLNNCRYVLFVS